MNSYIIKTVDLSKVYLDQTGWSCSKLTTQLQHLYKHVDNVLVASAVMALVVCGLFWTYVPKSILLSWFVLLIVVILSRYLLIHHYAVFFKSARSPNIEFSQFVIGITLCGFFWSLPIIFATLYANTLMIGVCAIIIAGLSTGMAVSASASRLTYLVFVLSASVPGCLYLFATGLESFQVIASGLVVFQIFLFYLAKNIHETVQHDAQLQEMNHQLLDCMQDFFEHIDESILIVDIKQNIIVDANQSANRLLGYDGADLVNLNYQLLGLDNDSDLEMSFCGCQQKGSTSPIAQEVKTQSGKIINCEALVCSISGLPKDLRILMLKDKQAKDPQTLNVALLDKHQRMVEEVKLLSQMQKHQRMVMANHLYDDVNSKLNTILIDVHHLFKSPKDVSDEAYAHMNNILDTVKQASMVLRNVSEQMKNPKYTIKP